MFNSAARAIAAGFLAIALSAIAAPAADMHAVCPEILPEDSIKPGRPVSGWVTVPAQMHLEGAGMMAGAPETETYLVPSKNTKDQQIFEFQPGDGQRWFWCGYGGARLARRLDDRASVCTISLKRRQPELFLAASVFCK